jgi:type IV pilus assembly protein PilW
MPVSRTRRLQLGLTLIELMISIAIGLVVVGAVSYAYLGSKGAYRGNESLARIQEGGRFALDSMMRDIRRAGALGCGSLESASGSAPALNVISPAGLVAAPIQGFVPASYAPLPVATVPAGLPPGTPAYPAAGSYWGGDVLQLQIVSGTPVRMSDGPDTTAATVTIASNSAAGFAPNDVALLADCASAAVFQVASVAPIGSGPATLIGYAAGAPAPALTAGKSGFSTTTFPTLQHFDQVTYYLGVAPGSVSPDFPNGLPALYRYSVANAAKGLPALEEVVENIEDMDIVYGVDVTPGDGVIAADEFGHAGDISALGAWGSVVSVKVSVIAVGNQKGVATAAQTLQFRGPGISPPAAPSAPWTPNPPDTRLRQVFSATAALRDRVQ